MMSKFKKAVILDTVIFYPEHRKILNTLCEEIVEYPSSLPESLEKQYQDNPEMFKNIKCYTELGTNDTPVQLLMNRLDGADVVVSCWTGIPDEVLRLNPQLKLVVFWTHEKEHRINLKLAEEMGIQVVNIPDYGTNSVSECVFAGLLKIIEKNFSTTTPSEDLTLSVLSKVFTLYRKIDDNEKNTRAGKFSHHFHKLGLAKFNFDEKSLAELIPERLVEDKKIGFLNIEQSRIKKSSFDAFKIRHQFYSVTDSNLAAYYKFVAENEYVFYDSKALPTNEVAKLMKLKGEHCFDVNSLTSYSYNFSGKTFGIVGLGRIGDKAAKIAENLGFRVIYYSRTKKENTPYTFVSLEELAKQSDVISVHVPAYKANDLLSKDIISLIKPGAIFINTADGNAIDQTALSARMTTNEVLVYLDVYPGLPRKDILGVPMEDPADWKIKNTLASHVLVYRAGWKTQESIRIKTYKLLGEMTDYLIKD